MGRHRRWRDLLRDTVAEWRDVPRVTYSGHHIQTCPDSSAGPTTMRRSRATPRPSRTEPGGSRSGRRVRHDPLEPGTVEWRECCASRWQPDLNDVRAMMTAAANYAWANGFVAGFPTFDEANDGAGVATASTCPARECGSRGRPIDDLYFQEPKDERTCIVPRRFRNDDGMLTPTEATPGFDEDFLLERGTRGLADYYREERRAPEPRRRRLRLARHRTHRDRAHVHDGSAAALPGVQLGDAGGASQGIAVTPTGGRSARPTRTPTGAGSAEAVDAAPASPARRGATRARRTVRPRARPRRRLQDDSGRVGDDHTVIRMVLDHELRDDR